MQAELPKVVSQSWSPQLGGSMPAGCSEEDSGIRALGKDQQEQKTLTQAEVFQETCLRLTEQLKLESNCFMEIIQTITIHIFPHYL